MMIANGAREVMRGKMKMLLRLDGARVKLRWDDAGMLWAMKRISNERLSLLLSPRADVDPNYNGEKRLSNFTLDPIFCGSTNSNRPSHYKQLLSLTIN